MPGSPRQDGTPANGWPEIAAASLAPGRRRSYLSVAARAPIQSDARKPRRHVQPPPQPGPDRRFRAGRVHGRHLRRPRQLESHPGQGPGTRRTTDHHHRRGELPRLRRARAGAVADGTDAGPGRGRRNPDIRRHRRQGRPGATPVYPQRRSGRYLRRRHIDHLHRRRGPLAGPGERAEADRLRCLRLRHLRRLLLPRQGSGGHRRRQHGGRGGFVPHQIRHQGDPGPPARPTARR